MRLLNLLIFGITPLVACSISRTDLPTNTFSTRSTVSLRGDLQRGLTEFEPVLSKGSFLSLTGMLSVLPISGGSSGTRVGGDLTPLKNAIAAVKLAGTSSDAVVLTDVQVCLQAIITLGSLTQGYSCTDSSGNPVSVFASTFDTILEQFVGIFPPSTFTLIQSQMASFWSSLGLIPPANQLYIAINNSLASVVASNSGESVTAVERLQSCFEDATSGGTVDQDKVCFTGPNSSLVSLYTLFAGVLQQFVGVLPPNVINSIVNVETYFLSATGAKPQTLALMLPLNNAIESIAADLSGNAVTFVEQIGQCFSAMIMSDDPAAYFCLTGQKGPALTLQVLVNGIIQHGFGYFPPTVVLQLENNLAPYLQSSDPSPSAIQAAFQQTFTLASLGPSFVTCAEALEDCINQAVLGSSGVCVLQDKCTPLTEA